MTQAPAHPSLLAAGSAPHSLSAPIGDPVPLRGALATVIAIHTLMLFALYTGTAPHPPSEIVPFALGPFLTAVIAVGCGTWTMAGRGRAGAVLALITAALALVSLGPQKYIDPAFSRIWPAVLTGQIAIAALIVLAVRGLRAPR